MVTARATSTARSSRREGDLEAQIQHALQQLTLSRAEPQGKDKYARFARGEAAVAKARAELAPEPEPRTREVRAPRVREEARELEAHAPLKLGSFGRAPTTRPTFAPAARPRADKDERARMYGRNGPSPFSAPSGAVGAAQRAASARSSRPSTAPSAASRPIGAKRAEAAAARPGQQGPFTRPQTAGASSARGADPDRDIGPERAVERKQVVVSRAGASGDRTQLIAYTMGERVGQGAYASVRMGWRKEGGERVAVKVYDKHNLTRESRRRNVQREVHVLGKVSHPHIVGFHEWFATDRHVYIVLEYVSGGSLQSLLRRQVGQRFDEAQGKRLHFQVLVGIQYLHNLQVMHRDLKLENLLLDAQGVVRIIDFGFAVVLPPGQKLKVFCGTPSYIAPEIISGTPYSLPADIWAIGVLLYVMLSGRFPFKASSQRELYRRIVRSSLQVPTELSPQAQHLVSHCLKKDDDQRPTATALLNNVFFANCERIDEQRVRASTTSSVSGSSLGGLALSDATTATPTDAGLLREVAKLR